MKTEKQDRSNTVSHYSCAYAFPDINQEVWGRGKA